MFVHYILSVFLFTGKIRNTRDKNSDRILSLFFMGKKDENRRNKAGS